ncbi:MAG: hypothetical protein QNK11_08000 [Legionella sp.]|nr:hypothetical protein [Legionella sp.]
MLECLNEARKHSVILLGAGGHAKVQLSLLQVLKSVCAPELDKKAQDFWRGICV